MFAIREVSSYLTGQMHDDEPRLFSCYWPAYGVCG
ncbi:Uncharacterised protein [Vibrio cholerae]|nr:Uncharacterised protein [Vibrio cholerae]CSC95896.1 Uncharacterised protein [Vibrio cholerae]